MRKAKRLQQTNKELKRENANKPTKVSLLFQTESCTFINPSVKIYNRGEQTLI